MPLSDAIALIALGVTTVQPPPLSPNSKWMVNFVENMCLAERNFGAVDQPTIFAMRPTLLGENIEVRISQVDPTYVSRIDAGTVTLLPSGRIFPVQMTSFGPVTGSRRITSFYLEGVSVADLVTAKTIVVDRGRAGPAISLESDHAEGVVASMTQCGDGLMRQWGMDPVAMHKLSRLPKPVGGSEKKWFKRNDYPKAARANSRFGRTLALITISAEGGVTSCKIAVSAGNPDLDSKTCAILTERGRYDPGLDAEGKPVPSQKLLGVVWTAWPFFW